MHAAGLHHQDFYTGHLLLKLQGDAFDLRVIDLGRARGFERLSQRWVIKDLAQFDYSARELAAGERVRFLKAYLGKDRRLDAAERQLVRSIRAKSRRIARHSRKNRL
jgi:heptose I phosphotransferase